MKYEVATEYLPVGLETPAPAGTKIICQFPVPYSYSRLISSLTQTRADLTQEHIGPLSAYFKETRGPWDFAEQKIAVSEDESERIILRQGDQSFVCYKSQSSSEFVEALEGILDELPKAGRDAFYTGLHALPEEAHKKGIGNICNFG
jgi:hypothetical protein